MIKFDISQKPNDTATPLKNPRALSRKRLMSKKDLSSILSSSISSCNWLTKKIISFAIGEEVSPNDLKAVVQKLRHIRLFSLSNTSVEYVNPLI